MIYHILYLPGLGHMYGLQRFIINLWASPNTKTHFVPLRWYDSEPYESKLKRVTDLIDQIPEKDAVCLVGVSAGASMALNAYCARKDRISKIVYLCGKLRNPQAINQSYFIESPAFEKSAFRANELIKDLTNPDKQKMFTIRSWMDGVIPAHDSEIPGVQNKVIHIPYHVITIFIALLFRKNLILKFLRA